MTRECRNCGQVDAFISDNETGDIICTGCGLIQTASCTDTFEKVDDIVNAGISTLLTISDLKVKSTFQIMTSQRSMQLARELVSQWCFGLALPPDVKDRAMQIYQLTLDANKTRGRKIEEISAACLWLAAKEFCPRPLTVFQETTLVDRKIITKQANMIRTTVKLQLKIVDPVKYIPYLCTQIGRKYNVQQEAERILNKANTIGQNPRIIAAASCYLAAMMLGEAVTITECAIKTQTAAGILVQHIEELKKALV